MNQPTARHLADKLARARKEIARAAQDQSVQAQRQLQARFEGERDVAAARLMVVERPEWRDRADIGEVAGMYETAQQWKDLDPAAQAAADTIARQVKDRYGIDVANPGADPQTVRAALGQAELDRDQAARVQRGTAAVEFTQAVHAVQEANRLDAKAGTVQHDTDPGAGAGDNGDHSADTSHTDEAARLELQAREYEVLASQGGTADQTPAQLTELATAARSQAHLYRDTERTPDRAQEAVDGHDSAQATAERNEGQLNHDSAARREATANELKAHGIPQETIDVRMRADIAQGRPANTAAAHTDRVHIPTTNRGHDAGRSAGRPEHTR